MPPTLTPSERLRALLRRRNGLLRMSEALREGLSRSSLYAMRDPDEIEVLGRGLYRLKEMPALAHPDLVTVAAKIPRAVICLVSALAHHDLTTQVPHEVQIALARGTAKPRMA
jgi:predicted transcriptional regulator of viral defense system